MAGRSRRGRLVRWVVAVPGAAVLALVMVVLLEACGGGASRGGASDGPAGGGGSTQATGPGASQSRPAPASRDLRPSDGDGVWTPGPGTTWQWQLQGRVETRPEAAMYDIDLFDAVPSRRTYSVSGFGRVVVPRGENAGVIPRLHRLGRVVICYVDTGAWESFRPDAELFPRSVLGRQPEASDGTPWAGERYLDIRRGSWSRFEPIMLARFDLARAIGCDGVEPDQNNSALNRPGFPVTLADEQAWYLELAGAAHERGLSVGMKNGLEVTGATTVAAFDWNLNEECHQYDECGPLDAFVRAGKAVFVAEYTEGGMTAAAFCPEARRAGLSGLLKHLDLGRWREAC